jgi:hypothetical protein
MTPFATSHELGPRRSRGGGGGRGPPPPPPPPPAHPIALCHCCQTVTRLSREQCTPILFEVFQQDGHVASRCGTSLILLSGGRWIGQAPGPGIPPRGDEGDGRPSVISQSAASVTGGLVRLHPAQLSLPGESPQTQAASDQAAAQSCGGWPFCSFTCSRLHCQGEPQLLAHRRN